MLDAYLKPRLDRWLDRVGRRLAAAGLGADAVTLAGLVLGLVAAAFVAAGVFGAALIFLLLGRLADGIDGAIARATNPTSFGGYFDICADFAFYGAFPLAFVMHDPAANGAAGAFLLASFYLNGATFLGFAVLAEKRAMRSEARGRKGFYHSGGLLEGTETIAFFVGLCLVPALFPLLATAFAALCLVTAVQRLLLARRLFGGAD